VCSRSSVHFQAIRNFSGARLLLDHIIGIHAGMVEAKVDVSHGVALIAASAHQVGVFGYFDLFLVFEHFISLCCTLLPP
jgi:hypothetical protein